MHPGRALGLMMVPNQKKTGIALSNVNFEKKIPKKANIPPDIYDKSVKITDMLY